MARLIRTAHWATDQSHPELSGVIAVAEPADSLSSQSLEAEMPPAAGPNESRKIELQTRADERRRISRLLHDEVGQSLTAITVKLAILRARTSGAVHSALLDVHALLEKTLGQVQRLSKDLHPSAVEDLGLVPALRSYLKTFCKDASTAVQLRAKDPGLSAIESRVALAVFRSVQALLQDLREAAVPKTVLTIALVPAALQLEARTQIPRRPKADALPDISNFHEQVLIAGGAVRCRTSRGEASITAQFPMENQGTV